MKNENLKIGITLSGGGIRAAIFHLGVLARLSDEGLLEKIEMISTVSGGTLLVGMIYTANKKKWPNSIEFKSACIPFVKKILTEKNLQINAIIRTFLNPWLFYYGRAKILSESIKKCWSIDGKLSEIPLKPRWNINSCTIESGKSWRFVPGRRMGDYIINYVENPEISLADVLSSSAAVPFLIGNLLIRTKNYKWFKYTSNEIKTPIEQKFKKIHIWDGGVYDNLGMEALVKLRNGCFYRDELNFLIVSDASKELGTGKPFFQSRAFRLLDITTDQVRSLRSRILMDHFNNNNEAGVYLRIGCTIEDIIRNKPILDEKEFDTTNYSNKEIVNKVKNYKTTLKRISINDFFEIFKHGWEVTNATLITYCPTLFLNKIYKANNYFE